MKAGTRLDALVAEQMGYTIGNDPFFGHDGRKIVSGPHWITFTTACHEWLVPEGEGDEPTWLRGDTPITCPRWSTDFAAAWKLHQQVCRDGGRPFTTRKNYLEALGPIINERLHREGKLNEGLAVDWPWLLVVLKPEDICLAALKAKGVENEDQDA